MKKLAMLLLIALVLGGCGNGNNDAKESAAAESSAASVAAAESPAEESPAAETATTTAIESLDDLIKVFTDAGIEVDPSEQPLFQMIGAQNGVIFYMEDNKVVKIYEYKDADSLEEAVKQFEMAKDWPANGRFLLETTSDKAKELFAGAK